MTRAPRWLQGPTPPLAASELQTLVKDVSLKAGVEVRSERIAHDLDQNNTQLLRDGRISAVLDHDLNQDMRRACHVIMQAHRALPGGIHSWPSSIQVVTPYNAPQPPPPELVRR